MKKSENPFQAPRSTERPLADESPAWGLGRSDLIQMTALIVVGGILCMIDYRHMGPLMVFVPAAVFLVLTVWCFVRVARSNDVTAIQLFRGVLLSIIAVPACYICLATTCTMTTEAFGVGAFRLHGGPISVSKGIIGGLLMFLLFAVISHLLVACFYWYDRSQGPKVVPQKDQASDKDGPG